MPDKRTHRGPHPADAKLFASAAIPDLRLALADFSLLLTKGYADRSALKLVGDRFSLTERQRTAIMRSACSDRQLASRRSREVKIACLSGRPVAIDGYNLLITIEAAMSGACVFKGRDGCFRDLASIHGTYRKVAETIPAVQLIGQFLKEHSVNDCLWLLDSPVSNSGRLKTILRDYNLDWQVELVTSPDAVLIKTDMIVATSDSVILDGCRSWVNLARAIIEEKVPEVRLVDLS
jgi:hypothetical protein